MTNAIAISRNLVNAGVDKTAADAIAEEVVNHSNESYSTKADITKLVGDIKILTSTVEMQGLIFFGMFIGLYVGFAVVFISQAIGG